MRDQQSRTSWPRVAHVPTDLDPPEDVRALIFDWDGTLADTTHANFAAFAAALRDHGLHPEYTWFEARTGLSTRELIQALIDAAPSTTGKNIDVDAVIRARNDAYLATLAEIRPVAVVVELAKRESKIRTRDRVRSRQLALATGGSRTTVLPTVDHLQLRDLFDVVLTREDVVHGKPAPDLFRLALHRLDVSPAHALVYEDSDEGLQAAARAGIRAIDVRRLSGPSR